MRGIGAHITRGALACLLCIPLAGCGARSGSTGSDAGSSRRESTVTVTQIEPEGDDEAEFFDWAGDPLDPDDPRSASHERLSSCLGSIAEKAADDHGDPIVSIETARELFTLTLRGEEEYELPCPVAAFLERDWGFELGYSFSDMSYDPGFSFEVGLWYRGDQNFNVSVTLKNTTDRVVGVGEMTVVGLEIEPMQTFVDLESKAGVRGDSGLDELLAVLGCSDESALRDDKVIVGYRLSLFDGPLYDMNSTIYADVEYDWNKAGGAMTRLSLQLLEPWDADLRKSDEELAEARAKAEAEVDEQMAGVGRTVEGV